MYRHLLLLPVIILLLASGALAQADEFCGEAGLAPSLDSPFAHVPYVFGVVRVSGIDPNSKTSKVTIKLDEGQGTAQRMSLNRSGKYCFRRRGSAGTLIVEVNGLQADRRSLPTMGPDQQREDFEIVSSDSIPQGSPGVLSAKYEYPRSEKASEMFTKAAAASSEKNFDEAARLLKTIVESDPKDFTAWAELGTAYFMKEKLSEAEAAYRKSLELKVDFTPSWVNMGKLRIVQKQYPAAIEIIKHAQELEPRSAKISRLLGEAYLQNKQGTLGAEALNHAIELDPIGMAECHLLLAKLYELAGAKSMASKEYKSFLEKVPEHPDKKKMEKYIKENP